MTVNQFLLDRYIGKKCKLTKREIKNLDGRVWDDPHHPIRINNTGPVFCKDWKHVIWTEEKNGSDKEFWYRDVPFEDKIVGITPKRNYWVFKTLQGYEFKLYNSQEIDII